MASKGELGFYSRQPGFIVHVVQQSISFPLSPHFLPRKNIYRLCHLWVSLLEWSINPTSNRNCLFLNLGLHRGRIFCILFFWSSAPLPCIIATSSSGVVENQRWEGSFLEEMPALCQQHKSPMSEPRRKAWLPTWNGGKEGYIGIRVKLTALCIFLPAYYKSFPVRAFADIPSNLGLTFY